MCVYSHIHTTGIRIYAPVLYLSLSNSFVRFVSHQWTTTLFLLPFLNFFPSGLTSLTAAHYSKDYSHPRNKTKHCEFTAIFPSFGTRALTRNVMQCTRPTDRPTDRSGLETCALLSSRFNRNPSPTFVHTVLTYVFCDVNVRKNQKGWARRLTNTHRPGKQRRGAVQES